MDSEELKKRTKDFAHRCVKLAMALPDTPLGRHIRMQLIRCGTSVGANYRSACRGRSRAEFAAKIGIVLEEVDETDYWLSLLKDSGYLAIEEHTVLACKCIELVKLLTSSINTTKSNSK